MQRGERSFKIDYIFCFGSPPISTKLYNVGEEYSLLKAHRLLQGNHKESTAAIHSTTRLNSKMLETPSLIWILLGHEFHTSSHSLRVPLLNVSNPSNFGGFGSISQSIRSHLLGLRAGGSQNSKIRPFSGFATLPLGVTSLVSPSRETKSLQTMSRGHFSAVDLVNSHIIQMKASN